MIRIVNLHSNTRTNLGESEHHSNIQDYSLLRPQESAYGFSGEEDKRNFPRHFLVDAQKVQDILIQNPPRCLIGRFF